MGRNIMTANQIRKAEDLPIISRPDYCDNCGRKVRVIAFLGTRICSENCRKNLSNAAM